MRLSILVFLLALTACALNVDPKRMHDHVIACSHEGTVYEPISEATIDAEERIDAVFEAAGAWFAHHPERPKRLLVHVHGGLNDPGNSLTTADENIPQILSATGADFHYPIFLTWDSGLLRSYGEYVWHLRRGRHAPLWGPITSPIYLVTDLLTATVNLPRQWLFQIGTDGAVGAKVAFDSELLPSWRNSETAYHALKHLDAAAASEQGLPFVRLGGYERGWLAQTGRFAAYLCTFPATLATSLLVGQGFGQGSWEGMLHASSNMFHRYDEFDLRSVSDRSTSAIREALKQEATGPFARFLDALVREQRDHGYEIHFVCHSMGAILVNEALQLLESRRRVAQAKELLSVVGIDRKAPPSLREGYDLDVRSLTYMAPACAVHDAVAALVPYMRNHPETELFVLTLHPTAEAEEINFLDLPPRGSLLEWIDNFYVRATSPEERTFGKWVNVMQSLHMFREVAHQMRVKGFGVGKAGNPTTHGSFNSHPFWTADFRNPAKGL